MINHQIVIQAVEADVREGLASVISIHRFGCVAPTEPRGARMGNDDFTTVTWEVTGVDDKGIDDLWPTYRTVVLEGATIVEHRQHQPDRFKFHRYVDWNSLAAQLGWSRGRGTAWFRQGSREERPKTAVRPQSHVGTRPEPDEDLV